MNPTDTSRSTQRRPLVKRWLPYFIIAAIVINTSLIFIPFDFVLIFRASAADLFGIDTAATPQTSRELMMETVRLYGNIALVIVFLIIAVRSFQERG